MKLGGIKKKQGERRQIEQFHADSVWFTVKPAALRAVTVEHQLQCRPHISDSVRLCDDCAEAVCFKI